MAAIETWLRQPGAQAVGWALLQFVWQGALVGAMTGAALLALRRCASDVRYLVSSIGLALMLTLPLVTGAQKYQALGGQRIAVDDPGRSAAVVPTPGSSRLTAAAPGRSPSNDLDRSTSVAPRRSYGPLAAEAVLPALLMMWLAGVSLLSLRLFTGWLWAQRLRTHGVSAADAACRRMASRLAQRLHIRRAVTLLESSLVEVPTVIGFLAPVVLLPASALAGLTAQQVEAILAHELAHIRRHDYLVNLLQTLVETVLFYHPAVWWLSRRIRIERENCCDDLAVSLCGDPVAYATALADLEALRSSGPLPVRHVAMAATGGSLLQRVRRLLGAPASHSGRGPAWLAGGVALVLVGGIALGAAGAQRAIPTGNASDSYLGAEPDPVIGPAPSVPQEPAVLAASRGRAPLVPQPTLLPAIAEASARVPVVGSLPASIAGAVLAPLSGVAPIAVLPAAPPTPALAAASSQSISHAVTNANGNWVWSSNGDRLEVSYHGTFEFTDDDSDVRQLSDGGWLKVSDGRWLGRHSVEIRERNGQIEHLYFVNGSARPYEPEGRAWLQQNLPRFVRNTGIGAPQRVARLLKRGGPAAVLGEIGRAESTYVKGIYFRELFKQASLTPEQYRQAMAQAAREMRSSSYELAQMLIGAVEHLPNDETSRAAYFDAASAISSDYDVHRVYSTMLRRGAVSPAILATILGHAKSIGSDYELSQLLQEIMTQQPLDERNRAAFFNAVATIDSGYERHRVLSSVLRRQGPTDAAILASALAAAGSLHSNYETSQFLQEVLRQNGVENIRAPFFAAANTIDGGYERGRVLQAVVRKGDASQDTLGAVLQSARALDGYELSQLLQLVARTYTLSGDVREAYLSAADRLSGYEQGQVMTALVRSERRK